MYVKFENKESMLAVGYLIPLKDDGPIDIKESGAYWQGADFSSVNPEEYAKVAGTNNEVGLWIHTEDSEEQVFFYGPVVENFDFVPEGLATLLIPAAEYAVFTTKPVNLKTDFLSYADTIRACWRDIFSDWVINQTEYEIDEEKYCFELYSSKGEDYDIESATVNIFVPIKNLRSNV